MNEVLIRHLGQSDLERTIADEPLVLFIDGDLNRNPDDPAIRGLFEEITDHCLILQRDGHDIFFILMEAALNPFQTSHPQAEAFISRYGTAPVSTTPESGIKIIGHLKEDPLDEDLSESGCMVFVPSSPANPVQNRYAERYMPYLDVILQASRPWPYPIQSSNQTSTKS